MPYPSVITSFPYPTPTNRLNNPSHSTLENLQSSTIGQLEAVIGLADSGSVLGTIIGDLRSPASNGGGHIQTGAKGGTGQTTYNKGDILVGINASTLSKLTVGMDGQALVANSSVAGGVNWATPGGTKINNSASIVSVRSTVAETSIFSVTIPGSTLGISGAVVSNLIVDQFGMTGGTSVLVRGFYGGGMVTSIMISPTMSGPTSMFGTIKYTLIGNGSANQQRGFLNVDFRKINAGTIQTNSVLSYYNMNTSSVNSNAPKVMGITVQYAATNVGDLIDVVGQTTERII